MSEHIYSSLEEIARHHGLFAVVGYGLSRFLGSVSLTKLLFRLPRYFSKALARFYSGDHDKSTPPWHDGCVLFLSVVTGLLVWAGFSNTVSSRGCAWHFACWYLLLDKIVYHTGVLWFDDLKVGTKAAYRKVWSHRRILFQAIINFLESVAIFAALYRQHMLEVTDLHFSRLIHYSFSVSTALSHLSAIGDRK